jgi:hypothetical protein
MTYGVLIKMSALLNRHQSQLQYFLYKVKSDECTQFQALVFLEKTKFCTSPCTLHKFRTSFTFQVHLSFTFQVHLDLSGSTSPIS